MDKERKFELNNYKSRRRGCENITNNTIGIAFKEYFIDAQVPLINLI
jgi:hypothetical protein